MTSTLGVFLVGLGLSILCITSIICLSSPIINSLGWPIIMLIYGCLSIIAGLDFIIKNPTSKEKHLTPVTISQRDVEDV